MFMPSRRELIKKIRMGDRGNIAIIQDAERNEQVWFYGHWSGWRMPAVLQHAIIDGKDRWQDPTYFARIVFCRLVPKDSLFETTSFGIGTALSDNEYPIIVADCAKQIVFEIPEQSLADNGRVPAGYKPAQCWTFEEYAALKTLPRGDIQSQYSEIGLAAPETLPPKSQP